MGLTEKQKKTKREKKKRKKRKRKQGERALPTDNQVICLFLELNSMSDG